MSTFPTVPPSALPRSTRARTLIIVVAVIVVLILIIAGVMLRSRGAGVALPASLTLGAKQTDVELKESYTNPLEKESQYVNPFDEFKSPFHSLQQ